MKEEIKNNFTKLYLFKTNAHVVHFQKSLIKTKT